MKKQNKRNQFTRITLALLLILSMLGNTLILPAVAQESAMPAGEPALPETPTTGEADTDSTTPTLPEPILLTAADVPEFISAAALEERGAVERMRSEETNMSSVIFRNSDGTRTMYMYGLPIKYTAADGTVRDKSTNLVSVSAAAALLSDQPVAETMAQMSTAQQTALQAELGILDAERAADTLHMLSTALTARGSSLSDMAYTTLDNDVYALFPTNLTEGMTLVFGAHSIRMTPATGMTMTTGGNVTKTTTASLSDADVTERLLYPNVFGPGTAVQYTPTLTGVKEEILLSYNVGKNSFDFLLETDGFVLTEQNGQFLLVNPETEQQVGKLGEIIVFDSAGQIVRGNMTAQTIKDGQIYGVTVSVDEEFLAGATYPVAIDPTMRLDPVHEDAEYGETVMIEDVSIYSDIDAQGYTFIEWHQIGQVIGGHWGQAAFRFPVLYTPSELYGYSTLTADQISSFTLHLKSTSNTTTTNILRASPYVPEWPNTFKIFDEGYYGYNNSQYQVDTVIYNVPSNSTFTVDLTAIVKLWMDVQQGNIDDYNGSPASGVLLMLDTYVGSIWVESVEYSDDIYATIDYFYPSDIGDFYLNSKYTRTFLAADLEYEIPEMRSGLISDIGTVITWNIEYEGDGEYSLHPCGRQDLYLDMYGNITDEQSEETMWTRSYSNGVVWTCSDGAVLAVDKYGEVFVEYPRCLNESDQGVWRVIPVSEYDEFIPFSMNTVNLLHHDTFDVYAEIDTAPYDLTSLNDFQFVNYDSNTVSVTGGVLHPRQVNNSTTIKVIHQPTGRSAQFRINVSVFAEGTYFIQNKASSEYANASYSSIYADLPIYQSSFDGDVYLRWEFLLLDDGYYAIRLEEDTANMFYMSASSNETGASIVIDRYDVLGEIGDDAKWMILSTSSGSYRLIPKCSEETRWSLKVGTVDGYALVQGVYTNDLNYIDEWKLLRILPVSGYELEYNPTLWSGIIQYNSNCYAYAINNQIYYQGANTIWFKQQMGELIGEPYSSYTKDAIESAVNDDFETYSILSQSTLIFQEIGRYETCPEGTYKVALVIDHNGTSEYDYDYHWYRQDADGLWSHKRGSYPVERTDYSGNIIVDPYLADRGEYTEFAGYYAVSPWNNLFSGDAETAYYYVGIENVFLSYEQFIAFLQYLGYDISLSAMSSIEIKCLEEILCEK